MKSVSSLTVAAALLSGTANAFWRMECHQRVGLARIDPLVTKGKASGHAHAIHGGSNFNMDSAYEDLRESNCTSCLAIEDKSAYWTPAMYFVHDNGTTEVVPQIGGMLAYYLLYSNEGETIEAFPPGFQMLTGDQRLRNFSGPVPDPETSAWKEDDMTQHALGQKAIGMNCMNYDLAPEPSMYRHFLPDKEYIDQNCKNGIRAELFFPSCWNGKLDSDDHKSHVAYPNLVKAGTCPEGFEKRIPSLFYETIWNTYVFHGLPGQFTFANGDPTGYGYHGDFINGWPKELLTNAVKQCTNDSGLLSDCPLFELQTEPEADTCHLEMPQALAEDNCAGPADGLCGNVQLQYGPGYATTNAPGNTAPVTIPAAPSSIARSEASAVPTLSYTTPKSAVTDKFGGGISVVGEANSPSQGTEINVEAAVTPSSAVVTSSSAVVASSSAVVASSSAVVASSSAVVASSSAVVPSSSAAAPVPISSSSVDEAPAPTPAPAPPAEQYKGKGSIVSTSTYTDAGTVHLIAIEEIYITVTADAPTQKVKRHAHHMHHRRDREHGLLRQH